MAANALMIVRSDLLRRIDGIASAGAGLRLSALCEQIDSIRRIARIHGLDAVERLASLIESAVSYHGHGPVVLSYLDLMRDAAESEAQGPDACTAYTAALSVRLAV